MHEHGKFIFIRRDCKSAQLGNLVGSIVSPLNFWTCPTRLNQCPAKIMTGLTFVRLHWNSYNWLWHMPWVRFPVDTHVFFSLSLFLSWFTTSCLPPVQLLLISTSKCGLWPHLLRCARSAVEMYVTMDSRIGTAKVQRFIGKGISQIIYVTWKDSPIYSLCGPGSTSAPSSAIPRC